MFCMLKKKNIYPYYISKHNTNREKQVILLMISNGDKPRERLETLAMQAKSEGREAKTEGRQRWHYLGVKKLSPLSRGITSKCHGYFYCLNCFHYFRAKNKLESHEKVRENKDSCNIIMYSEYAKILQFNQYQTSYTEPFIIYADLECIIGKTDGCKNNPENSSTTKVGKHIQSGFSTSTIS